MLRNIPVSLMIINLIINLIYWRSRSRRQLFYSSSLFNFKVYHVDASNYYSMSSMSLYFTDGRDGTMLSSELLLNSDIHS